MVKKKFVKLISALSALGQNYTFVLPAEGYSTPPKNPKPTPSIGLGGIQAFKIIKL
jgi:hypothetical protein